MRKAYTSPFWPSPEKLELDRQLSNYLIWLHMLDEGQPVGDGFVMLRVLCEAFNAPDTTAAIKVMDEAKERGTWRKADLLPLVTAINLIHGRPMLSKQDAHRVLKIQGLAA
jgi:hypothetical protein